MRRRCVLVVSTVAALAVTLAPGAAAGAPSASPGDVPRPVFANGEAQPVFDPADVVREEVWVRAPVDSDRDGRDDEVHVVVVRPRATELGMRVPSVYEISPYYAGGNDVANHDVDVELWYPGRPDGDPAGAAAAGRGGTVVTERATPGPNPAIGNPTYEPYFTARGFAMVYAESLGSGESTGCPTTGGRNETIGAKSVVDWLNGRAAARTRDGAPARATWSSGQVGMTGISYNGTLPNAVAATGVRGLEAIVPVAAISSWYDYYRADGAVVAPGGYQGEDADVLAEYVLTRANPEVCRPVIDELARRQDRLSGDFSAFWAERDYLRDAHEVRAATLAVHGLNDWNVKTQHVSQWYEALKRGGVPHKIWLHQFGHRGPYGLRPAEWMRTLNRWYTRYLWDHRNGVEREPRATIQREDLTWHDEAEWPHPAARDVTLRLGAGPGGGPGDAGTLIPRRGHGGHGVDGHGRPTVRSLVDDASITAETLAAAATSPHRLAFDTGPLPRAVRFSGTVGVDLRVAIDRPAANVTALLVDRAPDGTTRVVTRGWTDPQNPRSISSTRPVRPGEWLSLTLTMQPDDHVVPAGHRLGVVLLSSDHDYTLRPSPGTRVSVDLDRTTVTLPVVGGADALR